jgi:hypothetical protein
MAVSNIVAVLTNDASTDQSAFYTAVFKYGKGLIQLLNDDGFKPTGASGKIQVPLEVDTGDAETYNEGQSLPAFLEGTYGIPAWDVKHFRAVIRMTGHERRALGTAGEAGLMPGLVDAKIRRAVARIEYLMATTYDDAAAYGIQHMIDATQDFGGLSRTTYTRLRSYVLNANSAYISTSLLNRFHYLSQNDPHGAAYDLVLIPAAQAAFMAELGSQLLALPSADLGGGLNLVPTSLRVGSAPVVLVPNLTNTIVLGLTGARLRTSGETSASHAWGWTWCEPNPGRFHVLDLGAGEQDNPMRVQISTAGAMTCNQPHTQGKLYGLSAT